MNIETIFVYVISTAVLTAIAFVEVFFLFGIFLTLGTGKPITAVLSIAVVVLPAVSVYYLVKKTRVVWWYPSVAITGIILAWIASGANYDTAAHLLVPFGLLLLIGWSAHANSRKSS